MSLRESEVFIPAARVDGSIRLEGRLQLPEVEGTAPGVIVCHPHPAGGGSMDVPLISLIADGLASMGMVCLRFNFGGVGCSEGDFTDGRDEPGDVRAAFDFLSGLHEIGDEHVSIAGWSFGAWMGLTALADGLRAASIVAIAPPLIAYDWHPITVALTASATSRHYVVGDRDQFCPIDDLRAFAREISAEDERNVKILAGADHYLFHREQEVIGFAAMALKA